MPSFRTYIVKDCALRRAVRSCRQPLRMRGFLSGTAVEVAFSQMTGRCHLLKDGRCSIYADRPLLCRLFGAVPKMACPFGCKPDGGFMKRRDEDKVLELVYARTE